MNKLKTLTISNLTKKYYNKTALKNVTLDFKPGKIYGLLGPNGSGKTTFMKVVAGLHKKTSGEVLINNMKLSYRTKAYLSYMPTENFMYDTFSVTNIVKFYNDMYEDFRKDYAEELLHSVDINFNYKIANLSSGQIAKLKVVLALSRDVNIYMLDEPLNGVDILSRDAILDIILKSFNENKIIIIATHLVNEIDKILDRVIFLKDGSIELYGQAEELRKSHQLSIEDLYKEVYKDA
ncbi:MAG: ABC transporter ATP-binding protein [Tissierellia bacterium]|nr:ABC transporter ATP-binding protein [Tissierellia bacterium]